MGFAVGNILVDSEGFRQYQLVTALIGALSQRIHYWTRRTRITLLAKLRSHSLYTVSKYIRM